MEDSSATMLQTDPDPSVQGLQEQVPRQEGTPAFDQFGSNGKVDSFRTVAKSHNGLLQGPGFINDPEKVKELWRISRRSLLPPAALFRAYFGEEVAFYFAWMNFYIMWLVGPALLGLALYSTQTPGHYTEALYGVGMVAWGAIGMKLWRRRSRQLASEWGTLDLPLDQLAWRPEATSQSTDGTGPGTPAALAPYTMKRAIRTAATGVLTAMILAAGLVVIVASLNLQGLIQPVDSWLHMPSFARHAKHGALFGPDAGLVRSKIPVALHMVLLAMLAKGAFMPASQKLTDWERHGTQQGQSSSLAVKHFVFAAAANFTPLLYVALVRHDGDKLRSQLTSLYIAGAATRLLVNVVLPIMKSSRARRQQSGVKATESLFKRVTAKVVSVCRALMPSMGSRHPNDPGMDFETPPYDPQGGYPEAALEWGHVTLLAAVCPIAAVLSLLVSLVEVRAAAMRAMWTSQRPPVVRVAGIGSWEVVMRSQVWLSAASNALLIAASLPTWLPGLPFLLGLPTSSDTTPVQTTPYHTDATPVKGPNVWGPDYASMLIAPQPATSPPPPRSSLLAERSLAFIVLEHGLLLLVAALLYGIQDMPAAVVKKQQLEEADRTEKLQMRPSWGERLLGRRSKVE